MTRRSLGLAVATAVALVVPVLGSPALGAPASGAAGATGSVADLPASALDALCAAAATDAAASARAVPGTRPGADTSPVTARDLAAISGERAEARAATREARRVLPDQVTIPVHVSLVRGTHRGDTNQSPAAVQGWIDLMNEAYAGGQSADNVATRYVFTLASVRQVKNDSWYHAVMGTKADKQMRRTLHRGSSGSLNLYVTKPGKDLLGYSRFPWQYAGAPKQDGVVVTVDSLPGGRATHYNLGDTLVHEVGHWMGLLHTFQPDAGRSSGCGDWTRPLDSGDRVADTPPQAKASQGCPEGANTCKQGESTTGVTLDPVHNFMDYSYDSCMDQFTAGQVARMDTAFEKYRLRP